MRNLWQLFQGYGEVELKGMGLERALTQLERAGVTLWHIRRVDRLTITCRVPMHQKRLFRKTAAELPCHIAWRRERGLPGFCPTPASAPRAHGRPGAAGRQLGVGAICLAGGNQGVDDPQRLQEIRQLIEDCGYGPGAWWHTIELKEVERQLILQMPDAAGLVANRTGTTLSWRLSPPYPRPNCLPWRAVRHRRQRGWGHRFRYRVGRHCQGAGRANGVR